jgi:Flp pilus assembly CpaE family ATPase
MHPAIIIGIIVGIGALLLTADENGEMSQAEHLALLKEELEVAREQYEYMTTIERIPANDPEVVALLNQIRDIQAQIVDIEAPPVGGGAF